MKNYKNIIEKAIFFFIFFLISFNLGYATLNRFDPRVDPKSKEFARDPAEYYKMVEGNYREAKAPYRFRILIPFLSGIIYNSVKNINLFTWNKVFFSLLIINSIFISLSCIFLQKTAYLITNNKFIGILSVFFLLTNFAVINFHLSALVDSGELFIFILFIFIILSDKYLFLPLIIFIAALIKETSVIFISSFLLCYLLILFVNKRDVSIIKVLIFIATVLIGFFILYIIRKIIGGSLYGPHTFSFVRLRYIPKNLFSLVFSKAFIYTFILILPLSIFNLNIFPKDILIPLLFVIIILVVIASYASIGGENIVRPLFNLTSLFLTISASKFIYYIFLNNK